jgi:membrane-bound metal-dependent hydrolase YbcI (DUF457 family)
LLVVSHMAWGLLLTYAYARSTRRPLPSPWLVLWLGSIPDYDLYTQRLLVAIYGPAEYVGTPLGHHGIFHAWLAILLALLLLAVLGARNWVGYLIAVEQHILFGDFVGNAVPLFAPFTFEQVGLNMFEVSLPGLLTLEAAGFLFLLLWSRRMAQGVNSPLHLLPVLTAIPLILLNVTQGMDYLYVGGVLSVYAAYAVVSGLITLWLIARAIGKALLFQQLAFSAKYNSPLG